MAGNRREVSEGYDACSAPARSLDGNANDVKPVIPSRVKDLQAAQDYKKMIESEGGAFVEQAGGKLPLTVRTAEERYHT